MAATLFLGLGLLGSGMTLMMAKAITFYEQGIVYANSFFTRELAFDTVESYAFESRDMHQYGIYRESSFILTLVPRDNRLCKITLSLSNYSPEPPGPMENIRKRVQQTCVARMMQEIKSQNTTSWTNEITLGQDEIEIVTRKTRFRIAYDQLSMSWERLTMPGLGIGYEPHLLFFIRNDPKQKPVFKLSPHANNFFPGFECLNRLRGTEMEI